MRAVTGYLFVAIALCLVTLAWGQFDPLDFDQPLDGPTVAVEAVLSHDGVEPGGQVVLAAVFDIAPNWHIQVNNPSDENLIATKVQLKDLPPGVVAGDVQWPQPHPIDFGDLGMIDFYTGKAPVFTKLSVGEAVKPGRYEFEVFVEWQACDDQHCDPPADQTFNLVLNVVAPGTAITANQPDLFAEYRADAPPEPESLTFRLFGWTVTIDPNVLWLLLPLAAIGGFLLNLTPCVLPMIPIKIMGISQSAEHHGRALLLGAIMSLGVVAFWLAIGGGIAFIADFDAINELFQKTWFAIGVGVVIALMALGMFGLFAARLPQWVYRINPSQKTLHGSFGFGIMTAVLSTPCTAPFMGTAAAWAAKQAPSTTLATFSAIGVGMALPYLVLAAFPKLVDRMPRTGPASELIKQVMGLLMLAAAAFFAGTGLSGLLNEPPDPPSKAYWWPVGACIAAGGVWLAWRTLGITRSALRRMVYVGLGVVFIAAGGATGYGLTRKSPVNWVYFTPERLAAAQQSGDVVVLDFTAEWCLNCHTLERAVLHKREVVTQLNAEGVTAIKVDITNDKPAQAYLTEVGSTTIPLLIVYDAQGNEVFRSDAYTRKQVIDAVSSARRSKAPPAAAG